LTANALLIRLVELSFGSKLFVAAVSLKVKLNKKKKSTKIFITQGIV
jgi:hypothetical protein